MRVTKEMLERRVALLNDMTGAALTLTESKSEGNMRIRDLITDSIALVAIFGASLVIYIQ